MSEPTPSDKFTDTMGAVPVPAKPKKKQKAS